MVQCTTRFAIEPARSADSVMRWSASTLVAGIVVVVAFGWRTLGLSAPRRSPHHLLAWTDGSKYGTELPTSSLRAEGRSRSVDLTYLVWWKHPRISGSCSPQTEQDGTRVCLPSKHEPIRALLVPARHPSPPMNMTVLWQQISTAARAAGEAGSYSFMCADDAEVAAARRNVERMRRGGRAVNKDAPNVEEIVEQAELGELPNRGSQNEADHCLWSLSGEQLGRIRPRQLAVFDAELCSGRQLNANVTWLEDRLLDAFETAVEAVVGPIGVWRIAMAERAPARRRAGGDVRPSIRSSNGTIGIAASQFQIDDDDDII